MTRQTFIVRPPGPADQARWRQLYADYAAFYQVAQTKQAADQVWQGINAPGHEVNALLASPLATAWRTLDRELNRFINRGLAAAQPQT